MLASKPLKQYGGFVKKGYSTGFILFALQQSLHHGNDLVTGGWVHTATLQSK